MPEGDPPIPLNPEQRQVVAMLLNLTRQCRDVILNPPGKTDKQRIWNSSQAAAKLQAIERELRAFNYKLATLVPKALQPSFDKAARDADKQLREAGVLDTPPLKGSFALVESRRAQVLVRRATMDLQKAVVSTVDWTKLVAADIKANNLDKRDIKTIIAGGTINGVPKVTLAQLRERCRAVADKNGKLWVTTKDGNQMAFDPHAYADLVYQTMGAAASNIATQERLASKGQYYGKFIGSNSARFCTAYVGKVYYFGPGTDPLGLYPHISALGSHYGEYQTFHVRCTKRLTAFIPSLATPKQIEDGKPDARTRELHGMDPLQAQKEFAQRARDEKAPPAATVVAAPPDVRQLARDARRKLREIGDGTAETEKRLLAERNRLSSLLNKAIVENDLAELNRLEPEFTKVVEQEHALAEDRRKAGRAILKVDNPAKITLSTTLTGERRDRIKQAAAELASMVDQTLLPTITAKAKAPEKGSSTRSYYHGGTVHMSKNASVDVGIHELGHLIEDASPTLHRAALSFLQRRTEGERLQSLRALTGLRYRPNEVARPDKFFNPYVGKDYGGKYSEVISMGVQYMWLDPVKFAAQDPDYFEFIFRVLRGDFRD